METCLDGEDVIEMTGSGLDPSLPQLEKRHHLPESTDTAWTRAIRSLLVTIARDVLHLADFILPEHDASLFALACTRLCSHLDAHYNRNSTPLSSLASSSAHATTSNASAALDTSSALSTRQRQNKGSTQQHTNTHLHSAQRHYSYGRYAHNQTRLFLVLHDIVGPWLCAPEAQQCLAILAHCRSISLLASTSALNVSMLWSPSILSLFNFRYLSLPSYSSLLPVPRDYVFFGGGRGAGGGAGGGLGGNHLEVVGTDVLVTVLQSVDTLAKELLHLLCTLCLSSSASSSSAAPSTSNEVPVQRMLEVAAQKMLVRSRDELLQKLGEFFDHKVLCLAQTAASTSSSVPSSASAGQKRKMVEVVRILLSSEDVKWVAGDNSAPNTNRSTSSGNVNRADQTYNRSTVNRQPLRNTTAPSHRHLSPTTAAARNPQSSDDDEDEEGEDEADEEIEDDEGHGQLDSGSESEQGSDEDDEGGQRNQGRGGGVKRSRSSSASTGRKKKKKNLTKNTTTSNATTIANKSKGSSSSASTQATKLKKSATASTSAKTKKTNGKQTATALSSKSTSKRS